MLDRMTLADPIALEPPFEDRAWRCCVRGC